MPTPASLGPTTGLSFPAQHFEVEQYVRVNLCNGKCEIGVVAATDVDGRTVTVLTRHGYELTVSVASVRRAYLLILDLNGVLIARGRGSFVRRPYVEEFVKFAFENFVVAVWTSGLERSCIPIVEGVLADYEDRLLFTLYRSSCTPRPTAAKPFGTLKNLQTIFDTYPKSFHAANTIIIDDSADKCSHPDIALCPVPFTDPVAQSDDSDLRNVMSVLEDVLVSDSLAPLIRAAEERELLHASPSVGTLTKIMADDPTPVGTSDSPDGQTGERTAKAEFQFISGIPEGGDTGGNSSSSVTDVRNGGRLEGKRGRGTHRIGSGVTATRAGAMASGRGTVGGKKRGGRTFEPVSKGIPSADRPDNVVQHGWLSPFSTACLPSALEANDRRRDHPYTGDMGPPSRSIAPVSPSTGQYPSSNAKGIRLSSDPTDGCSLVKKLQELTQKKQARK